MKEKGKESFGYAFFLKGIELKEEQKRRNKEMKKEWIVEIGKEESFNLQKTDLLIIIFLIF